MNQKENDRLAELEIEVRNNTRQLEKIVTNDLPHLQGQVAKCIGKLAVLNPLVIGIAVGVVLLIVGVAWKFIFGG